MFARLPIPLLKVHSSTNNSVEHAPIVAQDLSLFLPPNSVQQNKQRKLALRKTHTSTSPTTILQVQWRQSIGLRENLQETMVFTLKYRGFSIIFPSSSSMMIAFRWVSLPDSFSGSISELSCFRTCHPATGIRDDPMWWCVDARLVWLILEGEQEAAPFVWLLFHQIRPKTFETEPVVAKHWCNGRKPGQSFFPLWDVSDMVKGLGKPGSRSVGHLTSCPSLALSVKNLPGRGATGPWWKGWKDHFRHGRRSVKSVSTFDTGKHTNG